MTMIMTCGEKRKNLILPGFSRNAFVYLHFDATEAFVAKTVVVTQGVKGGVSTEKTGRTNLKKLLDY